MYKSTQKSEDFRQLTGSASTRILANGHALTVPDRGLADRTCKDQLAVLRSNKNSLLETMRSLRVDERSSAGKVLENLNREIGDLSKMIEDNSRARFEEIFVQVAHRRLSKDAFLELVRESREYWRQEGSIADVPLGSSRMQHKRAKKAYANSGAFIS